MPERESVSARVALDDIIALRMGYEEMVRRYLHNDFKPAKTETEYQRWKTKILALRRAAQALEGEISRGGSGDENPAQA